LADQAQIQFRDRITSQERLLSTIIGTESYGSSPAAMAIFRAIENDSELVLVKEERQKQVFDRNIGSDVSFIVFVQVKFLITNVIIVVS
jgi:hypothetical protein